ncbi:hypothetical protein [Rhizobium leguminosarum]|uniref:hypothetical protein n=1 Tax=Rhizobium leguminosarum TaxID=384 RepID=UPI0021BC25ED|nr:hypothetical protein [Rhizobium leguminosarum]
MKREYPSTPAEAFEASVEGAYYADQMAVADAEERIGVFPHVEGYPVHTISDIGMDDTNSVWLFQVLPGRVRMIGYFEHTGTGMDGMLDELERRGAEHAAATLTLTAASTLGANWHYCVIADGGDVTIDPNGVETIDGATTLVLKDGYSVNIICSGAAFFTNKLFARIQSKADSSAVGEFVVGLILSNNGGNPNTHVDFSSGSARSGASFVSSAASFTKRVTGTFAAGTGAGGLDAGAVAANATYFAYALRKDADLSFDVVLSTSPTIGGVNTTLLTGYPSAARQARAGYVLLAEKSAAEAQAAEMERQRNAAAQATEEHRKRLAAASAAEQAARDTLETEIQSYELQLSEKNRACAVTAADRQWLLRH